HPTTVLLVPGILVPRRVNAGRVLAVVLQHNLQLDSVLLGRVDDLVPLLGGLKVQYSRLRLALFRPIQALAVVMSHPDSGPVLSRLAHFIKASDQLRYLSGTECLVLTDGIIIVSVVQNKP